MRLALHQFSNQATHVETTVVCYAGPGIEIDKQTSITPADARRASDRDLNFEALPLGPVGAAIAGATPLRLGLFDACRDNPFVA